MILFCNLNVVSLSQCVWKSFQYHLFSVQLSPVIFTFLNRKETSYFWWWKPIQTHSRGLFYMISLCRNVFFYIFLEIRGIENMFALLLLCCIMILLANINRYCLNYDFYSLNTALKTAKVNANSGCSVLGQEIRFSS